MTVQKPKWIIEAEKYIGEKEIKGQQHNPLIVEMFHDIKRSGIKNDETPWCAAFVGSVLERVGIKSTRFESAKSYLGWGEQLLRPMYGCVAVLTRDGGGHVGFVVGQSTNGDLQILGGNQGDAVNVRTFPRLRVSGYRWPAGVPDEPQTLPEFIDITYSLSED
ncbi:TIGR02594 family protein [Salmonella enterica subsp. enterica serovar Agbeni]|nr:TIGR02594 family protein [Salmonella enterica subsp. enterica serovar Telelkebir]EEI9693324.1 TIGR02594 family protein [Salmonella enterica subsp. enterica serovar Hillingdon]EIU1267168.1 TIGR02594 family protein [Salmonella enterica subsp. enterica serovar Agbeni]